LAGTLGRADKPASSLVGSARCYRFGFAGSPCRRFKAWCGGTTWLNGGVSHSPGCDFGAGGSTNRSRSRPGISVLGMRIGWAWTVAAQSISANVAHTTTICKDVGRHKRSALRRAVSPAHAEAAVFRDIAGLLRNRSRIFCPIGAMRCAYCALPVSGGD
jgi:hypothetical protein